MLFIICSIASYISYSSLSLGKGGEFGYSADCGDGLLLFIQW